MLGDAVHFRYFLKELTPAGKIAIVVIAAGVIWLLVWVLSGRKED
jgi:hypothetical protein